MLEKLEKNPYDDLYWNIPEQKRGTINIVGGNEQSFRVVIKTAEFLANNYRLETVGIVLPDALRGKLPEIPGMTFLKSTEPGSFADGDELKRVFDAADYNILMGDLSKNSVTAKAIASAVQSSGKPLILTRDTVDLIAAPGVDRLLLNENLVIFGSVAQLSKMFKTAYYPKVLTMSQSLVQIAEALHKFTLSYPAGIVTLHNGQLVVARNGRIAAVPLDKTSYLPFTIWNGECAAKIAILNLYNPGKFVEATVAAVFGDNNSRQ